jgi:hypothetical protein
MSRLRRFATIFALALVANVVACAASTWDGARSNPLTAYYELRGHLPHGPPPGGGQELHCAASMDRGIGVEHIASRTISTPSGTHLRGSCFPDEEGSLPEWCDPIDLVPSRDQGVMPANSVAELHLVATGWPVRCLAGEAEFRGPWSWNAVSPILRRRDGLAWFPSGSTNDAFYAATFIVPLRPIWSGLVIDVLVWCGLIAAVPVAWTQVRRIAPWVSRSHRRATRGQCFACGYPLGGSERCPECGTSAARA